MCLPLKDAVIYPLRLQTSLSILPEANSDKLIVQERYKSQEFSPLSGWRCNPVQQNLLVNSDGVKEFAILQLGLRLIEKIFGPDEEHLVLISALDNPGHAYACV
ncbi:unnamed protein product [Protopolystoma xenopodis]|uniref:Uncharacterized protein n=1 Tax=Protopolystoma xenopodis TaxID=117903 RepID=A0A3S5BW04_9PLAT|nr:unnamed protein product [Protopolystoma xenopodis]